MKRINMKNTINRQEINLFLLQSTVTVTPFLLGGYYEWSSCLVSLALLLLLALTYRKTGCLLLPRSFLLLATVLLSAAYGVGVLWAVDRGMALLGFAKHLPLPLFVLSLAQLSREERESLWTPLPMAGAIMTLASFALGYLDRFVLTFRVDRRLAGFYEYPNTFALFLLICVVVLLFRQELNRRRAALLSVLLFGIALSGSRTVFVLWAALTVFCLFTRREGRRLVLLLSALLPLASVGYVLLTGRYDIIGRYLTISLNSGTLLGRLLYARDALPVILRHPLGLGYMGYYYAQGSFQTGIYSVMHVHNDLLQLLLDVGWLPTGLLVPAIINAARKPEGRANRAVIAVVCAHCLLDFDLQFVSIWLLLLLAVYTEPRGERVLKRGALMGGCAAVLAVLCLYCGAASALYAAHRDEDASRVYPGYTAALIRQLTQSDDLEAMEGTADRILRLNKQVPLAYSAKARAAFARGEIMNMIAYKKRAIALAKYRLDEYLDYFDMLRLAVGLYLRQNDAAGAAFCAERLREIPDMLRSAEESASSLGSRIEPPYLILPEEYQAVLDALPELGL